MAGCTWTLVSDVWGMGSDVLTWTGFTQALRGLGRPSTVTIFFFNTLLGRVWVQVRPELELNPTVGGTCGMACLSKDK